MRNKACTLKNRANKDKVKRKFSILTNYLLSAQICCAMTNHYLSLKRDLDRNVAEIRPTPKLKKGYKALFGLMHNSLKIFR